VFPLRLRTEVLWWDTSFESNHPNIGLSVVKFQVKINYDMTITLSSCRFSSAQWWIQRNAVYWPLQVDQSRFVSGPSSLYVKWAGRTDYTTFLPPVTQYFRWFNIFNTREVSPQPRNGDENCRMAVLELSLATVRNCSRHNPGTSALMTKQTVKRYEEDYKVVKITKSNCR